MAAAMTPAGATPVQAAHTMAYTAAGVAAFVYAVGFICSFFLPEPGHEDVDEHGVAPGHGFPVVGQR